MLAVYGRMGRPHMFVLPGHDQTRARVLSCSDLVYAQALKIEVYEHCDSDCPYSTTAFIAVASILQFTAIREQEQSTAGHTSTTGNLTAVSYLNLCRPPAAWSVGPACMQCDVSLRAEAVS